MSELFRLADDQLERLADLLAERGVSREDLVSAERLAKYLGVDEGYVYAHADELGARRLGAGPKARLRFSLREVDERLRAMRGGAVESPVTTPKPRRRPSRVTPTGVRLLPIRGKAPASPRPQRLTS